MSVRQELRQSIAPCVLADSRDNFGSLAPGHCLPDSISYAASGLAPFNAIGLIEPKSPLTER